MRFTGKEGEHTTLSFSHSAQFAQIAMVLRWSVCHDWGCEGKAGVTAMKTNEAARRALIRCRAPARLVNLVTGITKPTLDYQKCSVLKSK